MILSFDHDHGHGHTCIWQVNTGMGAWMHGCTTFGSSKILVYMHGCNRLEWHGFKLVSFMSTHNWMGTGSQCSHWSRPHDL